MRITRVLLLIVCCVNYVACNQAPADKVIVDRDFKIILVSNDSGSLPASRLFDSLHYVPLETNPDCIIGRVKSLAYVKSRYFIHDNLGNQVLIFDSTGHFLKKISISNDLTPTNMGKVINDFTIDEQREKVYVVNADTRTMYAFNFRGKLLDKYQFKFFFYSFEYHPSDDSFIFYTLSSPNRAAKDAAFHNYIIGDIKGNIISTYGYINECQRNSHVAFTTEFIKCSDRTMISPKLTDSFYLYKQGEFRLTYAFRFSNHIPINAYCTFAAEGFYQQAARNNYSFLQKVLPTDKYLYYEYFNAGRYLVGIYDKKNAINKTFKDIDMDFSQYYTNRLVYPQFSTKDELFSILNPMDVVNDSDYVRQTIGNYRSDVQNMLLSIKRTNNPILVHYISKS
jgi:hypothetical protein